MEKRLIGTKTGHSIGLNLDGSRNVIKLQVEISDEEDIQTVQLYNPSGDDSIPIDGSEIIIIMISETWKIGVAADQLLEPSTGAGEKRIYSLDAAGNILADLWLKSDGKNYFNGGIIPAARKDDAVQSTAVEDNAFWTWVAAVSAALNTLGIPVTPVPTSLTGKIIEGTEEVLLP